jgi:hypothetical protein
MNAPTLFSQPPPTQIDATKLGPVRSMVATESGFTVHCERGALQLSLDQFESLRRTLTPTKGSRP